MKIEGRTNEQRYYETRTSSLKRDSHNPLPELLCFNTS